jgi:hypothetical protein
MLALTAACIVAVLVAVWTRIAGASGQFAGLRAPATALAVVTPIGLAIFTLAGPLQQGWARRAGTPASLLGHKVASVGPRPVRRPAATNPLTSPFTATLAGTVAENGAPGGAIVDLALQVRGQVNGRMRVRLGGVPIGAGGGLSMTGSQVDLALAGQPAVLQGKIVSLRGEEFVARLSGGGATVNVHAQLQIDTNTNSVTGTLSGAPA